MLKYILQLTSIILTISLLFCNIYITKQSSFIFTLIVMLILLVISFLLYGYKRINKRDYKYKIILVTGFAFLLQSILYLVSSKTGFVSNYSSIFEGYVKKSTILIVFITVIAKELIRFIVVNERRNKKIQYIILNILLVIMCVFIDLSIATKSYNFNSFSAIYEFIAIFLLPAISKNILLNYLSYIGGYPLTFIYVFIMDLYIFFLPIRPKLNMLIEAVILLVFPYIVYYFINDFFNKKNSNKEKKKKQKEEKDNKLVNAISTIVFIILVCLVSREFTYSMIGIGSGSMTGTINKGDAIIYKRYDKQEDVKGKVIVFRRNDVMIVHRVIGVKTLEGRHVYQTKGDANNSVDNWVVEDKDIVGIVEARVPLVAWPSVILGELF